MLEPAPSRISTPRADDAATTNDWLAGDVGALDLDAALAHWREHGWARLGRVLDDEGLAAMRARADALMLGEVRHDGLFFQHDAESGRYEDLPLGEGWRGPSLEYRKMEKLEKDPVFLPWIENRLFERIARAVIGERVVLYRAVLMTKGARGGTPLPWHQDGGTFWGLDRHPELQLWTALDDAPSEAGCVEVVDRSHRDGLATPNGGVVPANLAAARDAERAALPLPAKAGEALVIHNHLWHRSGANATGRTRRALSVCYMDAATRCLRRKRAPRTFFPLFARSTSRDG